MLHVGVVVSGKTRVAVMVQTLADMARDCGNGAELRLRRTATTDLLWYPL